MRSAACRGDTATKCGAGDTIMEMGGSAETAIWRFGEEGSSPLPRRGRGPRRPRRARPPRRRADAPQAQTPLGALDWSSKSAGPEGSVMASHALQQDVEVE